MPIAEAALWNAAVAAVQSMQVQIISTFEVDDIWGKLYSVPAGYIVPQHQHEHDHVTLFIRGRVKVWVEEKYLGVYHAPHALKVEAGRRHTFEAVDECVFCCLHNLRGTGLEGPAIEREYAVGDLTLE